MRIWSPGDVATVGAALLRSGLVRPVSSLAGGLQAAGIGPGDRVGVLCRNHRELVRTAAALSAIAADVLLLNASFAGPQLAQVLEDTHASAVVYDADPRLDLGQLTAPRAVILRGRLVRRS